MYDKCSIDYTNLQLFPKPKFIYCPKKMVLTEFHNRWLCYRQLQHSATALPTLSLFIEHTKNLSLNFKIKNVHLVSKHRILRQNKMRWKKSWLVFRNLIRIKWKCFFFLCRISHLMFVNSLKCLKLEFLVWKKNRKNKNELDWNSSSKSQQILL